jgi:hypothetical protein
MARYYGTYRGICINNQDPLRKSRLQVKAPAILGDLATFARACVWPTGNVVLPSVGQTIWVMFEGGDASLPVWIRFEQRLPPRVNVRGIHAGVCVNTKDPAGKSRIQFKLPSVTADKVPWAISASGRNDLPSVGDTVWIVFEEGDPQYPIWLGVEP